LDYHGRNRNRVKSIIDKYIFSVKEIRQKSLALGRKITKAIKQFVDIEEAINELNSKIEINSKFSSEKINQFSVYLSNIKTLYEQDIIKIFNAVRALENENNELKSRVSDLLERIQELEDNPAIFSEKTEETFPKIFTCDTLSFNPDGFKVEDLKENYDNGIYVIEQLSDNEAKLSFNTDENVQSRKIGSMGEVFKRICKDYEPVWNPTYIKTETPGILTRQNDIWIIDNDKKMRIKLIKNENDE
jgi:predicted nuclease with TOPRIM domain